MNGRRDASRRSRYATGGPSRVSGDGGTGLAGNIARQASRIDLLFSYKNIGTGILIMIGLSSALLFLGFKGWVLSLIRP